MCSPHSPPPKALATGRRLLDTTPATATSTLSASNVTLVAIDNTTYWNVPTAQDEGACIKGECVEIEVGGWEGGEVGFQGSGGV